MLRFAIFAITYLSSATLYANDFFDAQTGDLDLSGADFAQSFESNRDDLLVYGVGRRPVDADVPIVERDDAIEGDRVLEIGGDTHRIVFAPEADFYRQFSGKRVEVRIWQRAKGTEANFKIHWLSGDRDGQLKRAEPNFFIHNLGTITLLPTGSVTSDGWQEFSSGEFDFDFGGKLPPAYISIEDRNSGDAGIESIVSRDPEASVEVDGLSIRVVADAAVPIESCTVATEDTCGAVGMCFLGTCVDAATYLGAAPVSDSIREDLIARRAFEVTTMNGVRIANGENRPVFDNDLSRADSSNAKTFWTALTDAFNALTDGHGSPPSASTANNVAGGACVYLSHADLLPNQPTLPMVWERFDAVPYGQQMQPGDVITAIDGIDPFEFADLLSREDSYGGDPRGRETIFAPQLLSLAAQSGAVWEVTRCPLDRPCAEEELVVFEVDPKPSLAPIWDNAPPSFRFIFPQCDFRVDRLNGEPDERSYGFAGAKTEQETEIVMFNGFPRADTGDGQSGWFVTLNEILGRSPQNVILDQRWGTGGFPDALGGLLNLLLAEDDPSFYGMSIPNGTVPTPPELVALSNFCQTRYCGMFFLFGETPSSDGPAAQSKVALLNGYNVSANDFFARRMAARPGRTRIFGHAPVFGAYGFACEFPPHLPGERNVGYQCTDTNFSPALDTEQGSFESGFGVVPEERVLQKQSDIKNGVDTVRARAMEWLQQ